MNGDISFEFRALPRITQSSPIFGSALCDVNSDGYLDLYVVQNFSGPQRETGYMHGGVSQLLLGDGSGSFKPVSPFESGLIVRGDAASLTINDLNGDGSPDFLIGVNNGNYELYINQFKANSFSIRLPDYPKGRKFVGSKIWVYYKDNSVQLHQLSIGGGYLSQSAPTVFIGNKKNIDKIMVEWPDGLKHELDVEFLSGEISYLDK